MTAPTSRVATAAVGGAMMTSTATLFSGGEGVGCGAKQAGLSHLWGIEYDDEIAQVARDNGFHVITADVTKADPHDLERPDILHASPPCPNFSVAKAGAEETEEDISLARATAHFIEELQPDFFTLENVYLYRKSKSWRMIARTLRRLGYGFKYWHLNSADYGVPQTRKRMIVIARRDGKVPQPPRATHADPDDLSPMFDNRLPWVGWYEAIEDLIPDLPESEFAPWQLERLPKELKTVLIGGANKSKSFAQFARDNRPTMPGSRNPDEPLMTLASGLHTSDFRAFIIPGGNSSNDQIISHQAPIHTLCGGRTNDLNARAFLAGLNANDTSEASIVMDGASPVGTLRTDGGGRALRAHVAGRVVQMTPRALARFQSFPDWYKLPDKKTLACRIIGNAVPPLMYQRIAESL